MSAHYLSRYADSEEPCYCYSSRDEKGIYAACTAIPLKDEVDDFSDPFDTNEVNQTFYIGEIMIREDYRGRTLGTAIMDLVLKMIDRSIYNQICLYTVIRATDHPKKPTSYIYPDNLWNRFGFQKDNSKLVKFPWKMIGRYFMPWLTWLFGLKIINRGYIGLLL